MADYTAAIRILEQERKESRSLITMIGHALKPERIAELEAEIEQLTAALERLKEQGK